MRQIEGSEVWVQETNMNKTSSRSHCIVSLSLRRRAKPDALLAAVARLPNEMAWHVLSFWPAEADVAPPSTPSPRPPPIISDESLLPELDGLVQAQKAQHGGS